MTDALFLGDLPSPLPAMGERVDLDGPEGRHAATVKRIRVGESVIIADGVGRAVRGPVIATGKDTVSIEVALSWLQESPALRITVAQALAKGDRSDLAVEMLTEVGVDEIWPWQSDRAIVRWSGERGEKSRAKWQAAAREATKQSRRLVIPPVGDVLSTAQLAERVGGFDLALVLHEDAETPLRDVALPSVGSVLIMVGPEGGISPEERDRLVAHCGRLVSISDGVLRTSTAGGVAVAAVRAR